MGRIAAQYADLLLRILQVHLGFFFRVLGLL